MSTELVKVQESVSAMEKIETGLAQLRDRFVGRTYDVSTAPGMTLAKADRAEVRELRFEVERARKAGKAPLLALGKWADQTAARITAEILKIETPIDALVQAEEARKEAEKQARIDAELARVAGIQQRLAELRGAVTVAAGAKAEIVLLHIADIEAIIITAEVFQEFTPQAAEAKLATLARLRELHAAAIAREAEQARIIAERAELAELRAKQEERDRLAKEAQAKADADAKAERDRLEEIAKAQRIAEAREHAEEIRLQREALEAEAAENRRIEAERRAQMDRQAEDARQTQAIEAGRLAAERAQFEADVEAIREANESKAKGRRGKLQNPGREAIVEVLANQYSVDKAVVRRWLKEIDWEQETA